MIERANSQNRYSWNRDALISWCTSGAPTALRTGFIGVTNDFEIVGAVVMNRDADREVDVLEHGDEDTASGAVIGGGIGLVVGLFAPPLLSQTAIGAGIGACSVTSPRRRTG